MNERNEISIMENGIAAKMYFSVQSYAQLFQSWRQLFRLWRKSNEIFKVAIQQDIKLNEFEITYYTVLLFNRTTQIAIDCIHREKLHSLIEKVLFSQTSIPQHAMVFIRVYALSVLGQNDIMARSLRSFAIAAISFLMGQE